jgi:uncharacterized membrane protein
MLPEPLHPALVHLPVALALIAPLVALGVRLAIRFAKLPAHAWLGVALLQALFAGPAWQAARVLTAVGGLVILGLAYDTGHSGGKLV